jgi:predicted ATPase/class 3 adenylate cyclase
VAEVPSGAVTLLFTDIEGSTRLLHQLGNRYAAVLAEHRQLLRAAFAAHAGSEFGSQGDALFVAFSSARDAVAAACEAQRSLAGHHWPADGRVRVRMGLHTGAPTRLAETYVGLDIHRANRLCAAGYGGQVLVSKTTRDLVEHDLPNDLSLRSRGEHRLKDLQAAEEIFELIIAGLPGDARPLRTLDTRRNNLPNQATPLVGRTRELAAAQQQLLDSRVRLLTLTGPGGTGKTRLALQVAAEVLEQFADGVCFVPLASINDVALVPTAIAHALGILQAAARQLVDTLIDYLRERQLLLVLDNLEHLLGATPLLTELLASCPRLKLLVTSRAVMHIPGERDFEVPPLGLPAREPVPPVEHLTQSEAVRLFVERAQAVKADFTVTENSRRAVVEICHRLDGLPLGIELAAARVRLLPPESMLVRLHRRLPLLTGGARDLPLRHQTLRAAISWSFDLLDGTEQRLFRYMPVFAGGCALEAVEAICASHERALDVTSGVASLVDKSLLRREPTNGQSPRFMMLETIREYALELLEASGEAEEARRRHAMYFMELAEAAEPRLHGPDQVTWLDRLEDEHDNLRAAIAWSQADASRAETGLRIASALVWFCMVRGYFEEGRRALEVGLTSPGGVPLGVRVKALSAAGHLANLQPDFEHATALLEEAIRLAGNLGDERAAARAQALLGETARFQREFARATTLLEDCLARQRRIGDTWGCYHTLYRLAETAREQGENERAVELHEQSLAMRQTAADGRGIAGSHHSLGLLALARGNAAQAAESFKQSLVINQQSGNKVGVAICLEGLAAVALARDDPGRAAQLLGAVEALVQLFGGTLHWGARSQYEEDCETARTRLGETAYLAAQAEGRAMSLDEAVEFALRSAPREPAERSA